LGSEGTRRSCSRDQGAPGTELTYRGGPLLAAVEVFTAYWGQAWNTTAQQSVITTLNDFFRFIVASPYVDQLGEYDAPPYKIAGPVGRDDDRHLARTRAQCDRLRHPPDAPEATLRTTAFPAVGPNTLYFVCSPPGVSVVAGGDRSCQAFCGYHDHIDTKSSTRWSPTPTVPVAWVRRAT